MQRVLRLTAFAILSFLLLVYVIFPLIGLTVFVFKDGDILGPCEPQYLYPPPIYPGAIESNTIYRNNEPRYELEHHYSLEVNYTELIDFFEGRGLSCQDATILTTVCSDPTSKWSTLALEVRIPASEQVQQYSMSVKWRCKD